MLGFGFVALLLSQNRLADGASCNLIQPLDTSSGEDLGIIMIPGAQIQGEKYEDLMKEIQNQFPGVRLWAGLSLGWLGSFPNPMEMTVKTKLPLKV